MLPLVTNDKFCSSPTAPKQPTTPEIQAMAIALWSGQVQPAHIMRVSTTTEWPVKVCLVAVFKDVFSFRHGWSRRHMLLVKLALVLPLTAGLDLQYSICHAGRLAHLSQALHCTCSYLIVSAARRAARCHFIYITCSSPDTSYHTSRSTGHFPPKPASHLYVHPTRATACQRLLLLLLTPPC